MWRGRRCGTLAPCIDTTPPTDTPTIVQRFGSLDAFYAADQRRRHSRERDVGLMWRGRRGATFRAAWVQETGEVYLYRHGHPADGGGTVDVLGRRFGLGELHAALRGYAEVCGRRGSLAWLLVRAGGGPGSVPAAA